MKPLELSIVIPCHNEALVLAELYARLQAVLNARHLDNEVIFINDGSTDDTLARLKNMASSDEAIRILSFTRNFGHQVAITAGLNYARGRVVIIMDADLQDPPELIPTLVDKWLEGHEIVLAERLERHGETLFKRWSAALFYRVLNLLSTVPIPENTGDFKLLDRRVVDLLNTLPERDRFLRGLTSWSGFKTATVTFERSPREAGVTKYTLKKMLRLATDGLLSFSIKPLRLAVVLGLLSSVLAVAGIVYALVVRLLTDAWVSGWTTTMIAVLFVGGMQLACLGIIGEYVGRIYQEVKRRPLYILDELIGFDDINAFTAPGPSHRQSREASR